MNTKIRIVKGETKDYIINQYDDEIDIIQESAELAYNQKEYTYEDILKLEEKDDKENPNNKKRYELIDGQIYEMSSPTTMHQEILGEILFQFKLYFKDKKCKPIMDLNLNIYNKSEKEITSMYIPDLQVVCNQNMFSEKMINGAPSLVVEVLSPSSKMRDKFIKYNKYQECGVKEYWIIDSESKKAYVYELNEGKYLSSAIYDYVNEDIKSVLFKKLIVSLKELNIHMIYDINANEETDIIQESAELAYNQKEYTYEDILKLEEKDDKENPNNKKRYELIDGQIYEMSSPSLQHQRILLKLAAKFDKYFKNKRCEPIIDFNLNMSNKKEITNMYIPDLQVVCNQNMFSEKMINGVPSLVVEILSPSSKMHDKFIKYNKYQECGVKEYWIIDSESKKAYVYELKDGKYVEPVIYDYANKNIQSVLFKELIVSLKELY